LVLAFALPLVDVLKFSALGFLNQKKHEEKRERGRSGIGPIDDLKPKCGNQWG
jgi:hypothetical protein